MREFGRPPWDENGFFDPTPPSPSVRGQTHTPVLSALLAAPSNPPLGGDEPQEKEKAQSSSPMLRSAAVDPLLTPIEPPLDGPMEGHKDCLLRKTPSAPPSTSRDASPPCLTASRKQPFALVANSATRRATLSDPSHSASPSPWDEDRLLSQAEAEEKQCEEKEEDLVASSQPQPIARALDFQWEGSHPRKPEAEAEEEEEPKKGKAKEDKKEKQRPCACGTGRPCYRNASGYVCSYCTYSICFQCLARTGQDESEDAYTDGNATQKGNGKEKAKENETEDNGDQPSSGEAWLWAAVEAALTSSPPGPSSSPNTAQKARPVRCPRCQEGVLQYEEVLLHEWTCEGAVPDARARRGGRKAAYDTLNIQRYYFIKEQHQKRAFSTEPLQAFFHGAERVEGEEDAAAEPRRASRCSGLGLKKPKTAPITTRAVDEGDWALPFLSSARSIVVEPVESDENSDRDFREYNVGACEDNPLRGAASQPVPCCVEGGSFVFSVQNPRLEQRCVWCAADRMPRQTHPVFLGDGSVTPLLSWRCPPSLPGLAPRRYRVRVPYGAYGLGQIHALSLYLMSDIFRKASRQVASTAAGSSLGQSLSAVKVIPAQRLPPLLTVEVLHGIVSHPRPCIAQIGQFRTPKRHRSPPQSATKRCLPRRESSLDLLSPVVETSATEGATCGDRCSSSLESPLGVEPCDTAFSWPDGLATRELSLTLDHLLQGRSVAVFGVGSKYAFLQHVAQSAALRGGFGIQTVDASRGGASFQPYFGTAAVGPQLRGVREVLRGAAADAALATESAGGPGTDRSHAIEVEDERYPTRGGHGRATKWDMQPIGLGPAGGIAVPFFAQPLPDNERQTDPPSPNKDHSHSREGSSTDRNCGVGYPRPIASHSQLVPSLSGVNPLSGWQDACPTQRLPYPTGKGYCGGELQGEVVAASGGERERERETPLKGGNSAGGKGLPYALTVAPIRFASETAREMWFKRCRSHARRCVRWHVLPSIMAWRSMPCPLPVRGPSNAASGAFGEGEGEVGRWVRAATTRGPQRVLLVLHNVDLLSLASEAALLELCREFAYPKMALVVLLSFDHPQWPLTARAAALAPLQLALVQLRCPFLPRVHEMRFLDSLGVLTQLEATAAGKGGATAGGLAKGRNRAPLRDTIRRILLSLPVGFAELLRVLIATQAKHGETASVPIYAIEQEFEAHGILVSHGRMKAVQRELTSNRLAVYHPAEHALHIPQYRRLQEVLEEVSAMRSGGVEQRGLAETV